MTFGDFISLLLCLIMAGGLGILSQRILGFKIGGLFVSIFIGFVGAILGREMVGWFHLPEWIHLTIDGRSFPVMWCFIGSLIATAVVGMIARRGAKREKRT
ncbi:MAG TPA: hypothetical protein VKW04_06180 [Planctomycetota bacterium]|nr:hypothetical protein [Planctomycetota bacterium]